MIFYKFILKKRGENNNKEKGERQRGEKRVNNDAKGEKEHGKSLLETY